MNRNFVELQVVLIWKHLVTPIAQASVNENKSKFELFADLEDSPLTDFCTDLTQNPDSYAQQENDKVEHMLVPQDEDPDEDDSLHEETGQLSGNSIVLMLDTRIWKIGMVFLIKVDSNKAVTKIHVKFDDFSAVLKNIGTDK